MNPRRTKRLSVVSALAVLLPVLAWTGQAAAQRPAAQSSTVDIQVLNVSDFHGQLDPLNGIGGAAALSTYWQQDRANNPNTLLLTGGDAVGASPPLLVVLRGRPDDRVDELRGIRR
ncbi:MAG: hypothetical protein M3400_14805 [Actinomycetota bacterium]|nr:hypothetical protein [Actinomycetota bacterium]